MHMRRIIELSLSMTAEKEKTLLCLAIEKRSVVWDGCFHLDDDELLSCIRESLTETSYEQSMEYCSALNEGLKYTWMQSARRVYDGSGRIKF